MAHLFSEIQIRSVRLRNRIAVSPMCQYSSPGGLATDWHLVHLGARAVGGAALVMTEASAVEARGRISPDDLGIWSDAHIEPLARIARFIKAQGAVPGIQLAHAGRKASTKAPWLGGAPLTAAEGGWTPVGPSAIPFGENHRTPQEMTEADLQKVIGAWVAAAGRAHAAGFEWIEVHGAHGYLLHSFYSPLSNKRRDEYGVGFEGRCRLIRQVTLAVRNAWPQHLPLSVRLSCSDWTPDGWQLEDSIALSRELKNCGADLIDCSSGGCVPGVKIPFGSGYQVPFAERIRHEAEILTSAVGMITGPRQADDLIRNGRADVVMMAREFLRDPYWPLRHAGELGKGIKAPIPAQYGRAFE